MAIKGKSKSRSKQRSALRPPRHEPVAPPTPLLRRPWVQLAAGVMLGVLAMVVLVWVTNQLRASDVEAQADSKAAQRRTAATAFQQAVRLAYGQVGVVEPGIAPTIFADMDAALDDLAKGKRPADAEEIFAQAAADAGKARKELAAFDVSATVADQGFDAIAVSSFTGSARGLVAVLDLYQQAARIAESAAVVGGDEQQHLADVAVDLRDTARSELARGWTQYLLALQAGGIPEAPAGSGSVPGLGAG